MTCLFYVYYLDMLLMSKWTNEEKVRRAGLICSGLYSVRAAKGRADEWANEKGLRQGPRVIS